MTEPVDPSITVVVCSYNGADSLGACLAALDTQTIREAMQIVVVDDGSLDATADIARGFDVELIAFERNQGISKARNAGINAARAPIVAFTDDDCVPAPTWCERLLPAYERDEVIAVGGGVEVFRVEGIIDRFLVDNNPLQPLELELDEERTLPGRLALYVRGMWRQPPEAVARPVFSFPGANMSFRRAVLDTIGAFDERMTFGADDEYICTKARTAFPDKVLWFEPEAVIRHNFVGTLRDVVRRNYAYGRGHARSYRFEEDRGWPIIFPVPAILLVALVVLRRSRKLVLVPLLVEVALPQGILSALKHRRPSNLVFSYVRLVEEVAHNLGMLSGLIDIRTGWTSRRS